MVVVDGQTRGIRAMLKKGAVGRKRIRLAGDQQTRDRGGKQQRHRPIGPRPPPASTFPTPSLSVVGQKLGRGAEISLAGKMGPMVDK